MPEIRESLQSVGLSRRLIGRNTARVTSYAEVIPGKKYEVQEGKAAKYPTAPFRAYFAECWNIVFGLRRLDLASNFPQIPEKLVVAPIAPNTKEAAFEEFALSY